ncbi:MAG: sigma-70 family RNA polymerase sigma factor [Candidatus Aminicenantes bacterium]|nr:MAG: sigma-70 family RNA polymerase sigma factor [Candidatus Aminicenantes bacterium]
MAENDQILIDRFTSGDARAFQELVERYKKKVYYLAYDITGDHHEAEDVSQEVFVKAFRSLNTFRRDAKMSSWLYKITVNSSIDSLRKKSSKPETSMDIIEKADVQNSSLGSSTELDPVRTAESLLLQKQISYALQKVSPKERSVFVMRHYNDLKIREIAEILDISIGTVKALLFRSIKKLRKELSTYRGNPGLEVTHE